MNGRLRIVRGRIIDPSRALDTVGDVIVERGVVTGITRSSAPMDGETLVDAEGCIVAPGFIDLHTHLREPGFEHQETLSTGGRAAAAGGFTTICATPDTDPTVDTGSDVESLISAARKTSPIRVLPLGTVSRRQRGEELSEMVAMATAGAVGFTDAPRHMRNASMLRHALDYSRIVERPIIEQPQESELASGGLMHEGPTATLLGLPGIPPEAEEVAIARSIALARLTGGRLHLTMITTARGVELVRRAKEDGIPVTADVTPHHLTMTDEWLAGKGNSARMYDPNCKVSPPLRSERDRRALVTGLNDGTLDCVVTDHMPRTLVDKLCEFDQAESGMVGLETALGVLLQLVETSDLSLSRLLAAITTEPARVLGVDGGTLHQGRRADLVVFRPDGQWTVDPSRFMSRGRNTPMEGARLKGRVLMTIVGGDVVHREAA
ncbi:MAG TPA: dihydroorotase [Chloroflexota bacterium]|nr:dihydroorotase [Chloroflexota bacterium]